MRILINLGFVFLFLNIIGCASYMKRKECEKVNWNEYGQNLALKGVRPGDDAYVNECRKVEANMSEMQLDLGFKAGMEAYCKPDQAFITGKKGMKLNLDFCDTSKAKVLSSRHADGVKAYCSVENGFPEGSSGRAYTGICENGAEGPFMKEFRRGRKKYVQAMIADAESLMREKETKIQSLQNDSYRATAQLAMLPPPRQIIERAYDPVTRTMRENVKTEDPNNYERNRLNGQIENNNGHINSERKAQDVLRKKITEYRGEMAGLD